MYEKYEIKEDGTIWNKKLNRWVKMKVESQGYVSCCLNNKKVRVHRILAEAFIPNPENLPTVNHIDGDRTNNSLSNLEWASYSKNNAHAHKVIQNRKSVRKLSYEDIEYIKSSGKSGVELAEEFNMSPQHMNSIKRGMYQVEYKEARICQ
ncbi:MAG: HNH endonuclease [Proteobacteria bacterium]|nr:HNH endonuclease [Pseudomonadota bacterium]MCH9735787.1 HNH endonuclease [Actinomycetes bacterium]